MKSYGFGFRSATLLIGAICWFPETAGCQDHSDKQSDEVVALINGKQAITMKQVDNAIGSQLFVLLEKVYGLRRKALDDLIMKRLLEDEAKKRGITTDALKKELLPSAAEISRKQVDQFYSEHRDAFGTLGEEEAKVRIRMDMETRERLEQFRKALSELRSKAQITAFLTLPPAPAVSVDSAGPSKGPANAAVTIVEFSDFQCPYCKLATATLEQVLNEYKNNVRLVFKHSPLPIHAQAYKAAQAAACAAEQQKFWEYHDRLFNSPDLSAQTLQNQAVQLGLDRDKFDACLESERSRAVVTKDLQEARDAGVQGTPTFIVNGRVMRGAISLDSFKKIIDRELEVHSPNRKGSTGHLR